MTGWWKWFERFLETDPSDVGCDEAMAVLHVYVDLLATGVDAPDRYPGVASHLAACEACAESLRGLIVAAHDDTGGTT